MSERDIYDLDNKSMIEGRMISVELKAPSGMFADNELDERNKTFIKNLRVVTINSIISHLEMARAILEDDDTQTGKYNMHMAVAKSYLDCLVNKE